jgi:hypothetical protein
MIADTAEYVPLKQAAELLPRRRAGKKTHVATLYRWTEYGCRGVKLKYIMIGCTRCTTREWLADFCQALTSQSVGGIA